MVTRVIGWVLLAAFIICAADWVIFRMRGSPLNTVNVEVYLRTPLKGQKTRFDFLGFEPTNCARSLFPQYAGEWTPPCWWLEKHNQRWQ